MPPPGGEHGEIAAAISHFLRAFAVERGLGVVLVEAGFLLARNPDTVRSPDVAFISRQRLPSPRPKGLLRTFTRCCRRDPLAARHVS